MSKTSLIGRKVRGFKFDNSAFGVKYVKETMDEHIGKIGSIREYYEPVDGYIVVFGDNFCTYPGSEIEKHLVSDGEELIDWRAIQCEVAEFPNLAEPYQRMDPVSHPSHYTDGNIEVIDFIEDKALNFNRGNVVKYVARAGKKDPRKEIEDLKKARWYLDREVERLEK